MKYVILALLMIGSARAAEIPQEPCHGQLSKEQATNALILLNKITTTGLKEIDAAKDVQDALSPIVQGQPDPACEKADAAEKRATEAEAKLQQLTNKSKVK